jgi:hypothetical protein
LYGAGAGGRRGRVSHGRATPSAPPAVMLQLGDEQAG